MKIFSKRCCPLRDHYREPSFDNESLRESLSKGGPLRGIEWNVADLRGLLVSFPYGSDDCSS